MATSFLLRNKKIWVAGHRGMVGAALLRRLAHEEDVTVLTVGREALDLRDQGAVAHWLAENRPDAVVVAAAHVGGIKANNDFPADFLYNNLMIETNIIHGAFRANVEKLLFLGSSCIYPRDAAQPVAETSLLGGPLEPSNEAYAVAKIAGIKLCQAYRRQHGCDFIAAMPCNLYGPNDRFDPVRSHVIPALMLKMHEARLARAPHVEVWGSGAPLREFMHVDDLADALVFLLGHYADEMPINVGFGEEISIADLAEMIREIVGFEGSVIYNHDKPDGVPRKLMDSFRLRQMGWVPAIDLQEGLEETYRWFCRQQEEAIDAA